MAALFSAKVQDGIHLYEMKPVYVATFVSIAEAAAFAGVTPKNVSDSIFGGHIVKKKYKLERS